MGRKLERLAETLVVKLRDVEMDMIPQTRTSLAGIGNKFRQAAHPAETDAARTIAQGIVDTIREPLLVLDRSLRLVAASRAFCSTFGLDISDIIGRPLYELGGGEWNIPQLRLLLEQIISDKGPWRITKSNTTFACSDDERCCSTRGRCFTRGHRPRTSFSASRTLPASVFWSARMPICFGRKTCCLMKSTIAWPTACKSSQASFP